MMVKELFDEVEFELYVLHSDTRKVSKKDIITKDGRMLSQKQVNCLYNHFDLDLDITLDFIKNNNYSKISNEIRKALESIKPYYNPDYEDCGDRD